MAERTEVRGLIAEALAMLSLGDQEQAVRHAFSKQYGGWPAMDGPHKYWIKEIFLGHSEFGDSLIVENNGSEVPERLLLVTFTEDGDGAITFNPPGEWREIVQEYRVVGEAAATEESADDVEDAEDAELAESYAGIEITDVGIEEADATGGLTMRIRPIRPGWGRKKDNHYYPAAMLKRDAHLLTNVKMFEVNHDEKKRDNRTWVSTITRVVGIDEDSAPVCEVKVHDPNFAQRVRNLNEAGLLEHLQCSVLGGGKRRKGEVDGKAANIIEKITNIKAVDWVPRAGAGGKALTIQESNDEGEGNMPKPGDQEIEVIEEEADETPVAEDHQEEPQALTASVVLKALLDSGLPRAAQARLAEREYDDEGALTEAVLSEQAYVEALTPKTGGRPFGLGKTTSVKEQPRPVDNRPIAERESAALKRAWGGR